MRYFKDSGDGFYAVGLDVDPSEGWTEITEAEWQANNPATIPDTRLIIEAKKQAVRAARKQILDILTGIAVAAQLQGDTDTTAAYLVVVQDLKDITEDWPTDPDLVDDLVMQRYVALVAQCTPQMVSAFAQVAA